MKNTLRPLTLVAIDDIEFDLLAHRSSRVKRVTVRTEIDKATRRIVRAKVLPKR